MYFSGVFFFAIKVGVAVIRVYGREALDEVFGVEENMGMIRARIDTPFFLWAIRMVFLSTLRCGIRLCCHCT